MFKYLAFALLLAHATAWADSPTLSLRGFGSAGVVRASIPSYFLGEFDTYGTRPNFTQNTRLGLNISSNLGDGWTVASQFLMERNEPGYTPTFDWGFVSYQPMPEIAIRAGRLVSPTWLFSQQLKVGYSYLWIRPPVEVYSMLSGVSNVNGLSLLSTMPFAGGSFSTEIYAGGEDGKSFTNNPAAPYDTNISLTDMWGLDLKYSHQDVWTLHGSYTQSHSKVKVNTPYPITPPLYGTAVTALDLGLGRFFSLGGMYDHHNILFISEFARRIIDGQALHHASAWYGTLGYRIAKLTPYITYAWQGGLRGSFNTHPDAPNVTTLKKSQFSYLGGLNFQAHESVILKAEWQRAMYNFIDTSKNFRVNFLNASANFIF